MPHSLSRRGFLQVTTGAGALASLGAAPERLATGLTSQAAAPGLDPLAGWFDRPMRWVQLTLVENDPGRFDPQFWLDYFRRLHADAATLSAGGIVAYYPTEVPLHHRSAWLGTVRSVRRRSSSAAARSACTSSRARIRMPCVTTCASRIPTGSRSRERRARCGTGPTPICGSPARSGPTTSSSWTRSTARSSRSTGWTASSRTAGHRRAATASASTASRTSATPPARSFRARPIARDPLRRQFLEWKKARLTELWKQWDATVRAVNAEARFIPNGPPDLKTAGELAAIQFTDNQARRGLTPPWANGRRAKEYRSVMGRKPIGGIFSVGLEEPYRWKDSVQSEPEIRLWVAEGTANGMRPWVTKFSGVLYDRRWLPVVERIYQWHFENERYLRNETPLARVALLHSEQTETYHAGVAPGDRAEDHVLGMYHALIEARVPFELVHEAFLTPDRLDQFRLLILADAAALSDAQCEAIRSYVKRGGSVLATFATSLYDEIGQRRERLRPRRCLRRVVRRPHRRSDAELVSDASKPIRPPAGVIRSSTDSTTRRESSTACSESACARRRSFHLRSRSSRRIRICRWRTCIHGSPAPRSASSTCGRSAAAASSTSRGISTARSGTSCASTTGGCCETPSAGRPTKRRPSRSRAPACST